MKKSKPEKHDVELQPYEYEALTNNPLISRVCSELLASPRKRGDFLVLRLTEMQLKDLVGWVAAEANHAETKNEEEALGEVCELLEADLLGITRARNR